MKNSVLLPMLLFTLQVFGQERVLVMGNSSNICLPEDTSVVFQRTEFLPDSLSSFDALLIFSTAYSSLTRDNILAITNFLHSGRGLYIGCENWPLLAEGNQLSEAILNKQFWGEHQSDHAVVSKNTQLFVGYEAELNAGRTVVFFPLDPRMTVEVWAGDEPLVLSSAEFGGRLILDGGYSRFYCAAKEDSGDMLSLMIRYLTTR